MDGCIHSVKASSTKVKTARYSARNLENFRILPEQGASGPGESDAGVTSLSLRMHPIILKSIFPLKVAGRFRVPGRVQLEYSYHVVKGVVKATC